MKKLALSLLTVVLFIFYSSFKQNGHSLLASDANPTTLPPDQTKQRNSNTSTPTQVQPTEIPPTLAPSQYKDGVYIGDSFDVFYGFVQIQATIQNGKINDIKFLQSPNDRQTSIEINSQAMPILQSEAIQVQSANVDIVSGATDTSQGFISSLGSALVKAK